LAALAIPTDNALAETINGLYKAEVIHRRRVAITRSGRVRYPRMDRLVRQSPVGADRQHPPAEVEERCYAMLEQPAVAA
jgi:putative transposase